MSSVAPRLIESLETVRIIASLGQATVGEWVFARDVISIGRSPTMVDLTLKDKTISRRHCQLELREDGLWVRDLQSANGTWINGKRIAGEAKLDAGDFLSVGQMRLRAKVSAPEEHTIMAPENRPAPAEPLAAPWDSTQTERAAVVPLMQDVPPNAVTQILAPPSAEELGVEPKPQPADADRPTGATEPAMFAVVEKTPADVEEPAAPVAPLAVITALPERTPAEPHLAEKIGAIGAVTPAAETKSESPEILPARELPSASPAPAPFASELADPAWTTPAATPAAEAPAPAAPEAPVADATLPIATPNNPPSRPMQMLARRSAGPSKKTLLLVGGGVVLLAVMFAGLIAVSVGAYLLLGH